MQRVYERRGKNREEAAFYIGVGTTIFDKMVATGQMPQPKMVGTRTIWDHYELDQFFDRLPQRAVELVNDVPPGGGASMHDEIDWSRMRA
jgi:predicted DNA-binding transcriptional regulator AlpA